MPLISELQNKIDQLSKAVSDESITLTLDLHKYPELSGMESQTAAILADRLQAMGLEIKPCLQSMGFIATFQSSKPGRVIAFRVDMDALPIKEESEVIYASCVNGISHACGHDVHCAVAIGVARVLVSLKDQLSGTVRFIFQPEEEEISGAIKMIRCGALDEPKPDAIIGLHVCALPAGKLGWTDGLFLSGFHHYLVRLKDLAHDPPDLDRLDTLAAKCCETIEGLNTLHIPENDVEDQVVWQGMLDGDEIYRNFVVYSASMATEEPDAWRGHFGLGLKAANRELHLQAYKKVKASIKEVCGDAQVRSKIERMEVMDDVVNNTELVRQSLPALSTALGEENLLQVKAAYPFNCEDFAYYLKHIPGAMYWLGGSNPEKGKHARLHTPNFDVDEACIPFGVQVFSTLLIDLLTREGETYDERE
ncbi:MAG: amidohydrolase [Anaerolineaceae bacterium]|nr:amidohydrolase [Anaerolineaceae bacterium]